MYCIYDCFSCIFVILVMSTYSNLRFRYNPITPIIEIILLESSTEIGVT